MSDNSAIRSFQYASASAGLRTPTISAKVRDGDGSIATGLGFGDGVLRNSSCGNRGAWDADLWTGSSGKSVGSCDEKPVAVERRGSVWNSGDVGGVWCWKGGSLTSHGDCFDGVLLTSSDEKLWTTSVGGVR